MHWSFIEFHTSYNIYIIYSLFYISIPELYYYLANLDLTTDQTISIGLTKYILILRSGLYGLYYIFLILFYSKYSQRIINYLMTYGLKYRLG